MNKKIYLKEQTVNEVQLNDLYSAASKVEQQVISLAEMAVKFSNNEVKQKALALKASANEFSKLLSDILTGENNESEMPVQDLDSTPNGKDNLEAPVRDDARMEAKTILNKLKKLSEALDLDEDELIEPKEEEEKDILTDNEEMGDEEVSDEETLGTEIDLSSVFTQFIEGLEIEQIEEAKTTIIEILKSQDLDELIPEFESVVDVDTLNFALESLYNYADENDITVITL